MAAGDDWDAQSFANHYPSYNEHSTALFSQMHEVENRFRLLREHLNGNIPHDIKANEQEMEDRIEKIRHLQNDIFKIQFNQLSVHEFKAKQKNDDPFNIHNNNNNYSGSFNKDSKNKPRLSGKFKTNKTKSDSNIESIKESKIDDDNDIELEIEEKKSDKTEKQRYDNPFLDDDEDNDDEKGNDSKQEQYGKYQDILDSFEIEQNTTKQLLKKLKETTAKMKELNDLALGKHRQHQ